MRWRHVATRIIGGGVLVAGVGWLLVVGVVGGLLLTATTTTATATAAATAFILVLVIVVRIIRGI